MTHEKEEQRYCVCMPCDPWRFSVSQRQSVNQWLRDNICQLTVNEYNVGSEW